MKSFRQFVGLAVLIIQLFCESTSKSVVTGEGSFIITRLNNGEPIITEAMFDALGATDKKGKSFTGAPV